MTKFNRTNSEERRIITAKSLQSMMLEIKEKFIPETVHDEYAVYCKNLISQYGSVFNPNEIETEIEKAKIKNFEDRKRKLDETNEKRKKEVEMYLKNNIVKSQRTMYDFNLYNQMPINYEELIVNLQMAIDLENILSNNHITNKSYIGKLLLKLKCDFEDVNILLANLRLKNIKVSSSDYYFSTKLYNLVEIYHKAALLSIPLRYFKSNYKIICSIFEAEKSFWSEMN